MQSASVSSHRDCLLRALIDDHLSYSFQNTMQLDPKKIPTMIEIIRSHQLLLPQDVPTAFTTPIIPPSTEDKENYSKLKSHKQSIDKFIACIERLIASKGLLT